MASSSDVRDILSLPRGSQPGGGGSGSRPSGSSRPSKPKQSRPEGISRELYALLGDNMPSLALANSALGAAKGKAGFKPKFAQRRKEKARKWVWQAFENPARQDGMVLHHWVPKGQEDEAKDEATADKDGMEVDSVKASSKGKEPVKDYKFASFNTTSGVYSYSNDEYQLYLRDEDWTKEETDYLIELCHMYDLRFVVIHDRYEWSERKRSIEDLKARYYAVCRRLLRNRISTDDMDARTALLATFAFDKNREVERKKHVQRLFTRTPEQIAEEEALYVEARRLEQQEARFANEREDLLKLLGGWERIPNSDAQAVAKAGAGLTPSVIGADELGAAGDGRSKKRRKLEGLAAGSAASIASATAAAAAAMSAADDDLSATASNGATTSAVPAKSTHKQKAEAKQAAFDEWNCLSRFDPEAAPSTKPPYPHLTGIPSTQPPVAPSPSNPSSSHGVFLRSTRILAPRSQLLARAYQTLAELQPPLGQSLVFPTARNAEKWEGLIGAVTSGLEMKRQVERVEMELRNLDARIKAAEDKKNGIITAPPSAPAAPSPGPNAP